MFAATNGWWCDRDFMALLEQDDIIAVLAGFVTGEAVAVNKAG